MKSWMGAETALRFSIQYGESTRAGYLVFPDRLHNLFRVRNLRDMVASGAVLARLEL